MLNTAENFPLWCKCTDLVKLWCSRTVYDGYHQALLRYKGLLPTRVTFGDLERLLGLRPTFESVGVRLGSMCLYVQMTLMRVCPWDCCPMTALLLGNVTFSLFRVYGTGASSMAHTQRSENNS